MGDREGGVHGHHILCTRGIYFNGREGVLGSTLIKKWRYWPKGVPSEEILRHM